LIRVFLLFLDRPVTGVLLGCFLILALARIVGEVPVAPSVAPALREPSSSSGELSSPPSSSFVSKWSAADPARKIRKHDLEIFPVPLGHSLERDPGIGDHTVPVAPARFVDGDGDFSVRDSRDLRP
jgi:hypothetical protein